MDKNKRAILTNALPIILEENTWNQQTTVLKKIPIGKGSAVWDVINHRLFLGMDNHIFVCE